ncbi:MAG: hypothetical protein LBC09_05305 [Helicobacteraceae bacterium]|jgi:hypothetical protein|nr:hypothetical protein [Helicobacteraceae bacterium]
MLQKRYSLLASALALALALNACAAKQDQCLYFGEGIKVFTELEKFADGKDVKSVLDLNGDGINDEIVYLSITKGSEIAKDIIISNPFDFIKYDTELTDISEELSDIPHLALGIIHSATKTSPCERFIVYNNALLPEWDGNSDIKVVRQLLELFPSWKEIRSEELKDIARYDSLGIYQLGWRVLLYWNGKEYKTETLAW